MRLKSLIVVALFLSVIACKKKEPQTSCLQITDNISLDKSLENTWVLLGYKNQGEYCVPGSFSEISVTFDESNSFKANLPCNQLYGEYEAYETNINNIDFSKTTITEMACQEELRNTWETIVLTGLSGESSYSINGKLLSIYSEEGIELIFLCE